MTVTGPAVMVKPVAEGGGLLLENRRHLLVVASQCEAMPDLPMLGDRARRLHEVLRDPQLGGCLPALPDGRSLLIGGDGEPLDHTALNDAIDQAVGHAAARQATLVLALLGHGFKPGADPNLYFMASDTIEGSRRSGVDVTARLTEAVDEAGVDGVIALIDTCFAASAPPADVSLVSGAQEGRTRLAVLMAAAANEEAYDLRFSDAVSDILRAGIRDRGELLDPSAVKQVVDGRLPGQPAIVFLYDGIRALQGAGLGLWLAHNRQQVDAWDSTLDVEWVRELTTNYWHTPTERRLWQALDTYRWVQLTGPPGGGKSTLMAALTRVDLLGAGNTAHAMVFCDLRHTVADIAAVISDQLAVRLPRSQAARFIHAREQARATAASDPAADAWDVQVMTPLAALDRARVLIGIDGLDQLDPPVRQQFQSAVRSLLARTGPQVRIVVSSRPDGGPELTSASATEPEAQQEGPAQVHTATLDTDTVEDWLDARDAPEHVRAVLGSQPLVDEHSWLLLRLLLELADETVAVRDLPVSLQACYELLTDRAHAELPDNPYATVLPAFEAVLAAAGSTPIPLEVVHAALRAGGHDIDVPALRDLMVRLRHVVTRTHPGTSSETIRPLHATYAEFLTERISEEQLRNAHEWVLEALYDDTNHRVIDADGYALVATPVHALGAGRLGLLRPAVARLHAYRNLFAADRRSDWVHWLQRCEDSGVAKDDPRLYAVRNEFIHDTGEAGDAAGALRLFRELLPELERVLGSDDLNTLTARANIATWTGRSGNVAGALSLFRELLVDEQRLLGADHPETVITRGHVANWTAAAGDAAGALKLSQELLADQQRMLGTDNVTTLTTRNNISTWAAQTGDVAGALRLSRELLPDLERVLGADHLNALTTRNNIAGWTAETGEVAGALSLFGELLSDLRRVLGADHPTTLAVRSNIAALTARSGDVAEALSLLHELLADQQRVQGFDHPITLAIRGQIANLTGEAGDVAGALGLLRKLLYHQQRVLGGRHPDTLITRSQIAQWTERTGNLAGGLSLFGKVLADMQRVLGADHPLTLTTRSNIATLTAKSGDMVGALGLFRELLADEQRVLGADHLETFNTRSNIAGLTALSGDMVGALGLFRELLADEKRALGARHPYTLTTRRHIAELAAPSGDEVHGLGSLQAFWASRPGLMSNPY